MADDIHASPPPQYETVRNNSGKTRPFELRSQPSSNFEDNGKAGSSILYGDEENGREHVQDGVREAEAITQTWTRKSLVISYLL